MASPRFLRMRWDNIHRAKHALKCKNASNYCFCCCCSLVKQALVQIRKPRSRKEKTSHTQSDFLHQGDQPDICQISILCTVFLLFCDVKTFMIPPSERGKYLFGERLGCSFGIEGKCDRDLGKTERNSLVPLKKVKRRGQWMKAEVRERLGLSSGTP